MYIIMETVLQSIKLTDKLILNKFKKTMDQHTRGNWLIHDPKHHKDNQ